MTQRPADAGSEGDGWEQTQRSQRRASALPADLDATLLAARHTASAAEADSEADTVIAMRRLGATQEIEVVSDDPRAGAADEHTLIAVRREPVAGAAAPLPPGAGLGVEEDSTAMVRRARRTGGAGADAEAMPVRAAVSPSASERPTYRPRQVGQEQIFRTPAEPKPLQERADAVRAAHQQRAASQRRLAVILIVGGAVVVGALAGIVGLVATML